MVLPETFEIAHLFGAAGLRYWIFGGNGVELALGRELRHHEDLDVYLASEHALEAVRLLEQHRFVWHDEAGGRLLLWIASAAEGPAGPGAPTGLARLPGHRVSASSI